MQDNRRESLRGLTLDELKRSTTTSSPPAVWVQTRRESEFSKRLSPLESSKRCTPSPSPFRFSDHTTSPPSASFTFAFPTSVLSPSPLSSPSEPQTPERDLLKSDLFFQSMVREQEPARNPLAPSPANAQPVTNATEGQNSKRSTSPHIVKTNGSSQDVAPMQPVFGRPTQLGASPQPFARYQPLSKPNSEGSQRLSGGSDSSGHAHLFIRNTAGNRRPNFHKPQGGSNPLQALHRPPAGANPLSSMNAGPQSLNNQATKDATNSNRPRNTRVIDSSDDEDDVFEITKPTNLPTWQPKAFAHPTFSSSQITNPYFQPKPSTTTMMSKSTLVANTVADGGIWDDRYNVADPNIYLDAGKANEELKALFEGSVEDEDDKPRTRQRKKKIEKDASDLADNMKSLGVKPDESDQSREQEEEQEDDDGTVEGLKVKLLPHQIEGVDWMCTKERGKGKSKKGMTKGGILADDMGLGKTIQSIALMLTNRPPAESEGSSDSDIKYSRCTLIVTPLALIKQWEGELKDRVESSHSFKVCVHHGPQRAKSYKELRKYDIVITTYHTLSSEHAACSDKIRAGCLGVNWYRVILDEAHSIKNRSTKVTKAACALEAQYRWCLTGTPMQNNLDELQSLIHFLKIGPLDKLEFWKSRIVQPMNSGRGGLAIKRLQTALKGMMKRRTKDVLKQNGKLKNGSSDQSEQSNDAGFKIVKRTVEKVEAEFTREERAFYTRLESRIDDKLQTMKDNQKPLNYASALVLLLRLRQACNHAKLLGYDLAGERDAIGDGNQTPRKKANGDNVDDLTAMLGGLNVEMRECDICQAELSKGEVQAGALRCRGCEEDLHGQLNIWRPKRLMEKETIAIVKNDRRIKRRVIVDSDDDEDDDDDADEVDSKTKIKSKTVDLGESSDQEAEDNNDDEDEDSYDSSSSESGMSLVASTKIRHLLSILRNDSRTHKYIVFSFFTSMLDLIEPFLYHHHIKFARYDGSMRNDEREASLHSLRNDPTTRVLLCSLRAGSLGLNLTAASRVVILEPFWNPFVEEQAIDRVHRLNQTQDVVVYKLTIKDTVEARILELQEKKRELARITVEGGGSSAQGIAKLTLAEMMKLFEHATEHDALVDMLGMKDGKSLLDRNRGDSTHDTGRSRRGWWREGEQEQEEEKAARHEMGDFIVYDEPPRGMDHAYRDKDKVVRKKDKKEHAVYGRRW